MVERSKEAFSREKRRFVEWVLEMMKECAVMPEVTGRGRRVARH